MSRSRWSIIVVIAACGGRVDADTRDAAPDIAAPPPPDAAIDGTVLDAGAGDAAGDASDASVADTSWCPDGSLFEAGAVDAGAPWGFSDHPNSFFAMTRTAADEVYIGGRAYVAKLEANGKLAWAKTYGMQYAYAYPRAIDAYGNVLLVGNAGNAGPIDFGGGAIPAGSGFVVKLDPNAKFISQIVFPGGASYAWPSAIGLLSNGDLVVLGVFKGNVNIGGGMWSSQTNSLFFARYDTCGAYVLGKTWLTTAYTTGLLVDSNDDVVLTGSFGGTVDFGGGTLTAPTNDWDPWIAKVTATGSHIASRDMKATGADNILYPALDANNNVLVAGSTGGSLDFGGGTLKSAGNRDAVIAKFAPDLGYVWGKRYGDAAFQWATAPGVAQGTIVLSGSFEGSVDFGKGVLTAPQNNTSMFVTRLDGAGNTISSIASAPSKQSAAASGFVILPTTSSDILIAGTYEGEFQIGPKVFPTEDLSGTGFVLRFTP